MSNRNIEFEKGYINGYNWVYYSEGNIDNINIELMDRGDFGPWKHGFKAGAIRASLKLDPEYPKDSY
jgi:hypothetical protein